MLKAVLVIVAVVAVLAGFYALSVATGFPAMGQTKQQISTVDNHANDSGTVAKVHVQDNVDVQVTHRGRNLTQLAQPAGLIFYHGHVDVDVFRHGVLIEHTENHNLLVDAGKNWIRGQIGSTAPASNGANYIALTNTAITPGAGDTCLSGEITSNGLSRAQGAYATGATGVYTIIITDTATGAQSAQASALFTAAVTGTPCNAGDDGTMLAEATFTQVTLATNDQIRVTWTVTLS